MQQGQDKTTDKEVSMKPKSASEILEKVWSQTTFGQLVTDICTCDDVSLEDLAERAGVGLGALSRPSIAEAAAIARALGYDEEPFIDRAVDRMIVKISRVS